MTTIPSSQPKFLIRGYRVLLLGPHFDYMRQSGSWDELVSFEGSFQHRLVAI